MSDERPLSYWPESLAAREMREMALAGLAWARFLHAARELEPEQPRWIEPPETPPAE